MQEMVNMEAVDILLGYVRHTAYLKELEGELYFQAHELNPLLPSFEKPFYYEPAQGFMMTLTQALAYEKALYFGQSERAQSLINEPLTTNESFQAYQSVSGEEFLWRKEYGRYLDKTLWERYSSDPELREMLILTDPFDLYFVSSLDQTLGVLGDMAEVRQGVSLTRGKNLLGYGLSEVRERLLKEYIPVLRQTAKDIIPDPERSSTVGGPETQSTHGPAPFKHPVRDFAINEFELETDLDLDPDPETPETERPQREEPTLTAKDLYQEADLNLEEEVPANSEAKGQEFPKEERPKGKKKKTKGRPEVQTSDKSANEVYKEEQARIQAEKEKVLSEHEINQDLLQTVDDEIMKQALQDRERRQQERQRTGRELGD